MNILLLGAKGQVGTELQRSLAPLGTLIICDREQANLETPEILAKLVEESAPGIIVNAAAYTQVDKAESDQARAELVNASAVKTLAELAKKYQALLIHYSTDYVFDGKKDSPYKEDDQTAPLSVYGQTKRDGELAILNTGGNAIILRTSWVYAKEGHNFINTILKFAPDREEMKIVADQHGAPTSAALIADVTAQIIQQRDKINGTRLYHVTPLGDTNWAEYAQYVLEVARDVGWDFPLTPDGIKPITTKEYPTAATRPMNSRLDTSKLRQDFGIKLPFWHEDVDKTVREITSFNFSDD